mgnify:FL=1
MMQKFQTNDPLVIKEFFSSMLDGEGIALSKRGCPMCAHIYQVSENLGMSYTAVSSLAANWHATNRVMVSLTSEQAPFMINGHFVGGADKPLETTMFQPKRDFTSSIINKGKGLGMNIDADKFNTMYQVLTGRSLEEQPESNVLNYNSMEAKAQCLELANDVVSAIKHGNFTYSPKVRQTIEDEIISRYVMATDTQAELDDQTQAEFAALKAHDYLASNPESVISVSELSLATKAPARTIQLGFKKLFGLGPIEFHRNFRLHRVREQIKGGALDDSTILDLAFRFGFEHPSRFAQLYKNMFGVLPSQDASN